MRFSRDWLYHLVREDHHFPLDHLWAHVGNSVELSLESNSSLLGGSIHTEINLLHLITISEGIEQFISLAGIEVTLVSVPPWLWDLIEEKSCGVSLSDLLESEPLKGVWLLSVSCKWHWSGLRVEIVHSVIPCRSGVGVDLPSTGLVGSSPVWDLEPLEDGSWSSVETDVSDSFEEVVWMEILCIQMIHVVWLLVELVNIKVLNSDSYII